MAKEDNDKSARNGKFTWKEGDVEIKYPEKAKKTLERLKREKEK